MTRADTVIVGAGIAGLGCATELIARGHDDVLVLEAAARAGGPAETIVRGAYTIERGPSTVRGSAALDTLLKAAGSSAIPSKRAAPYVVSNGALVRLPPPLGTLLGGSFLPWSGIASVLVEPFRPVRPGPKTVRRMVEERFGPTVAARFADLLTLGIYGTSADQVGFESAFPALASALHGAGGRFAGLALRRLGRGGATRRGVVSTAHGIGGVCDRLAAQLGERLRLATAVRRVRGQTGAFEVELAAPGSDVVSCRNLVLAVPASAAARMLELPAATPLLEAYRSIPQTLVSFALEEPDCVARWTGLGFLVPTRERLPLLGCLFPSNLFDGRAPRGSLLLSVFAARTLCEATDTGLVRELAPILKRLLGSVREPVLIDVARYPEGIPLYDVGHGERTRALRSVVAAARGPILCGVAYDGVAFAAAAESGLAAARAVLGDTG